MFGKFLLTVAVIAVIWFGFRHLTRVAELRLRPPAPPGAGARQAARETAEPEAETMVECRVCGMWQPARTAATCGRPGCPY